MKSTLLALAIICIGGGTVFAQSAEPWQKAYTGEDVTGAHVLAFWNFDDSSGTFPDMSQKGHGGTLDGASHCPQGRFGACLESFPGWPAEDAPHAFVVPDAPELSPQAAFSIEMWICPGESPAGYGDSFLVDKKYVAHTDYQWILEAPDKRGVRRMRATLGFGTSSDTWHSSEPLLLDPGRWSHIAMTYDGAGTLLFFQDGRSLGGGTKPGRGSVCPGTHFLSLGDRIGSYYHGFPGKLDEVRIASGAREYRPITIAQEHVRSAYRRMETPPALKFRLTNNRRDPICGIATTLGVEACADIGILVEQILPGASRVLEYPFDTRLRPDAYTVTVAYQFNDGDRVYSNRESFTVALVARKPALLMPVIMWGVGGTNAVSENLPALKEIGFTHCLGLQCDYQKIWDAAAPVPAAGGNVLEESYRMLDLALTQDLGIVISTSPGAWLEGKETLLRKNPLLQPYSRPNVCCTFPEVQAFAQNVGTSIAQTYGDFPAFCAALIHTEVRDGTQLCFHEQDRERYRAASGKSFPDNIGSKNGVSYGDLPGFPENRVVQDDSDLLQFYRWFWREGDGWNSLHSALKQGLQSTQRKDLWSFFDPAVRVPPLWGSGGNVDFLSHWTYSYPDPVRIGLATDELIAMAKGGPPGQGVMKMTQVIWYRSQTAPQEPAPVSPTPMSPWEDFDPGADYITIAPIHLREAFWTKISRPIKGIMYHGWQSLVPTEEPSVYRYTHPETRHALKELIKTVVTPLGPTLLQVPAARSDVAFLESFTSAIFAGRGTYGWGDSRSADAYHVLMYAHLQPEVVYEETIMKYGLEGVKVLVLTDCDVLPQPVAARINDFQRSGGILVGDDRLCPAVTPDIVLPLRDRIRKADADKNALLELSGSLLKQLGDRYRPYVTSSVPDVLPYRRCYGNSDYLFAINDRREFGHYVGHHRLVMEQGLPAKAEFTVQRQCGHAYDLVQHREVPLGKNENTLRLPVELEPGGGGMWLLTDAPIEAVSIQAEQQAKSGEQSLVHVFVTGPNGGAINAIIPLQIRILDPDGRLSEFSGHYGAQDGTITLPLDFAANDTAGIWTVEAGELASGLRARHYIRLSQPDRPANPANASAPPGKPS